jgi:sigma-E factor negative regulatory protein RseB
MSSIVLSNQLSSVMNIKSMHMSRGSSIRSRFRVIFCTFVVCGLSPYTPVLSADNHEKKSARSLINAMSNAVRTLSYDGIFIYQRGGNMNALRLIHRADDEGEIERLVSLTGSPREIIRNKEAVTCFFSDKQSVTVEKSRPRELLSSQLPQSMDKLAVNYQFSIVGEDRVAGIPSWVVSIKPKDAYRYGYQFWIGQENSFLLKSELRNRNGLLLEQIMFTQLDILDRVPDELLEPSISSAGFTWYNNSEVDENLTLSKESWQVGWMPSGFSMNTYERYPIADKANLVNHIVYSDGLAMVSIFIEKLQRNRGMSSGLSTLGGVNAFAKEANGYQVTAVGEVPQATVKRMADSVIPFR